MLCHTTPSRSEAVFAYQRTRHRCGHATRVLCARPTMAAHRDILGLGGGDEDAMGSGSDGELSDAGRTEVAGDDVSVASSAEMLCEGCDITSKNWCPIAKKKKLAFTKVKWGKETKRKVRANNGAKVKRKVRCGHWCALCVRNTERWLKNKKYSALVKKNGRKAGAKKLRDDLKSDDSFKKRWRGNISEAIHLHSGGRSRLTSLPESVISAQENLTDVIDSGMKFYTCKRYKEIYRVEPAANKVKVRTVTLKTGQKVKGVYVRVKPEGEYDVAMIHRSRVTHSVMHNDGDEVLDESEMADSREQALAENSADLTGILSDEETRQRAQEAIRLASVIEPPDEPVTAGPSSDEDSSDQNDDSGKSECDDSDSDAPTKKKREAAPPSVNTVASACTPTKGGKRGSGSGAAAAAAPPAMSSAQLEAVNGASTKLQQNLNKYNHGAFDQMRGRQL